MGGRTAAEPRRKTINFLKWFSLTWIVVNFGLLELSGYWESRGWPPLLNDVYPYPRTPLSAMVTMLFMSPGVIALIALCVLLIKDRRNDAKP